jgi:hypothetical protein
MKLSIEAVDDSEKQYHALLEALYDADPTPKMGLALFLGGWFSLQLLKPICI